MGLLPGLVGSLTVSAAASEPEDETTESGGGAAAVPVLQGLGFPTLVTDAEGRISRLNDYACDLFGVDEQTRSMDQVAHRAQHLSEVSDDLHELVDTFRLTDDESAALDEAEDIAEKQVAAVGGDEAEVLTHHGGAASASEGAADDSPNRLSPDDF